MAKMCSASGAQAALPARARPAALRTGLALAALLGGGVPALADSGEPDAPVVTLSGEYILDAVAVVRGNDEGVRYVDLASIGGEVDLDAAAGWHGARLVAQVIAGTGQQPNNLAGTLQGINNSEVPRNRVKLYQLYLAQQLADLPVTLRVGFIDLNEEFYSNDAAGLLIAPAFGIGSELAATGPNGPAIFPSTALTASVRIAPSDDTYAAFAVVNAEAGVLGDVGGIRPLLAEGALLIGETGWTGSGKIALGAWSYTQRQDDIRLLDAVGTPLRQRAQGAYALLEWPVGAPISAEEGAPAKASLFARAGVSDGHTTPYWGGWQAGILVHQALPGRPDSQLSFGANQAFLSDKYRLNEGEIGNPLRGAETGLEVTLADQIAPWLILQADAQYVINPSRTVEASDAVILGLRFIFSFTQEL
jgi:porin